MRHRVGSRCRRAGRQAQEVLFVHAAARLRLAEWQAFAEAEVKKGGRDIFGGIESESKGCRAVGTALEGGMPVLGDMALGKLRAEWPTFWAKHSGRAPHGGMVQQTERLEPIATEGWLKVLKTYLDTVGLGGRRP